MSIYRQYASFAVLMTDMMLIKQGMTTAGFKIWHQNIKEIARKKRAMLEFVTPIEPSELYGMKNMKSARLLVNHVVINWMD